MTETQDRPNRLGPMRMAGYGVGDIGFNLFWTGLSVYLLYYYTDVLGITPITAGLIFGLSIIWDAVTDPIMGLIATRTRTRFGKFRPWILFGAPFMGVSFVMMFAAPILFPSALVAASAISHLVFRTLFTIVSIPYSSLSSVLTTDSDQRTMLSGARMLGAIFGALIATAMMPALAAHFGGEDLKRGWAIVSVVFAGAATVLTWIVFLATREDTSVIVTDKRVSLADSWLFVIKNKALWVIFAAVLMASFGNGVYGKTMVYFIKYNLDAEAQTGGLLGTQALSAAVSVPFWIWFAGRTSKRVAWLTGSLALCLALVTAYGINPATSAALMPFMIVIGACFGAFAVMFWATVPDAVEYGQWRAGVRDEGMAFSLSTFAQKTGVAIGVGLLGFYLSAIGYDPDAVQSATSLAGLRDATFLYPAGLTFVTAVIIWFYPIDKATHARMLSEIAARADREVPST